MTNSRNPPGCLPAALDYLRRGWSPIALCPPDHLDVPPSHEQACRLSGETPLWSWKEYERRLPSEREVRIYWNRNPRSNIGLALGPVSRLMGLRIDSVAGAKLLEKICTHRLPETLEFSSPDGIRCLLFAVPADLICPADLVLESATRDSLALLYTGSHLVVPPSRHRDGGFWTWRPAHGPHERLPALAPLWFIRAFKGGGLEPEPESQAPEARPSSVAVTGLTQPRETSDPVIAAPVPQAVAAAGFRAQPVANEPQVLLLSEIPTRPLEWLWPGRIPLGKLTVLDGDPGLGKSTVLLDLAARLSRGLPMPDGTGGMCAPLTLLTAEDNLADTVRPRLQAAGADLSRIHAFAAVGDPKQGHRPPVIPLDLTVLRQVLQDTQSKLLILDPFVAFLGGSVDSCKDQDVRRCLHRLAELAEEARCAVLLLRHLNKARTAKALYRGAGSIGIIGAARSGLLVARDPDSEEYRVLAVTKSNLTASPASLRFRLQPAAGEVCRIEWCGASRHTADDLVALAATPEESDALQEAEQFLVNLLDSGPLPADQCIQNARAIRISEKTLRRAKTHLRVRSLRENQGTMGRWLWTLPYPQRVAPDRTPASERVVDSSHAWPDAHEGDPAPHARGGISKSIE